MIEEGATVSEEDVLHDEDFPSNYVHMAHPDDYKDMSEFAPQFIIHSHFGRHNKLIVRAAWRVSHTSVVPMSFVCDTGAPSYMYMSSIALSILQDKGLLLKDDKDTPYVQVHIDSKNAFPATVEETPHHHKDANILGLKSLQRLSMHVTEGGFTFNSGFWYL